MRKKDLDSLREDLDLLEGEIQHIKENLDYMDDTQKEHVKKTVDQIWELWDQMNDVLGEW